jgi:hypothetical protein
LLGGKAVTLTLGLSGFNAKNHAFLVLHKIFLPFLTMRITMESMTRLPMYQPPLSGN